MEHFTWEWQIPVTQQDIDKGVRGRASACAVARAVYRAVGDEDCDLGVDHAIHLYLVNLAPVRQMWVNGDKARDFISAFDTHGNDSVKPTTLSFFLEQ